MGHQMSKFTLVADIHLKLRDTSPYINKFEAQRFLELFRLIEGQDTKFVILMGDIFHYSRPTLEEQQVFLKGLNLLSKQVYIIAGNHEMVNSQSTTFDYIQLPKHVEYIEDVLHLVTNNIRLHLCNYKYITTTDLKMLTTDKRKYEEVLISHARCTVPPHIKEEISFKVLQKKFSSIYMGDIHYPMEFGNVKYVDSPYSITYTTNRNFHIGTLSIGGSSKSHTFERVVTNLPNKIKIEYTDIESITQLIGDGNLYKAIVRGGRDYLSKFTNDRNIVYEKVFDEKFTLPKQRGNKVLDLKNILLENITDDISEYQIKYISNLLNLILRGK
jgi:DNA repair exonuclease SbcCD nuclease subunit